MGIARNTGYNIAGSVIPLVVSIVTVPLYIHTVGVERYGVLALCWLILGFMGFMNLGMGPAVAQRLASLHAAGDDERSRVLWTAIWLNLAMGAVAALLVLLFAGAYFGHMAETSSHLSGEVRHATPLLALMIPIVMLSGVMMGALQGREYFFAMNSINSLSSILMSLMPLVWAVLVGPDLGGLIAAALIGKLAALLLTCIVCRRAVPVRRIGPPVPALMRKLISYGGWVTITSLIVPVITSLDRFVVGGIAGAAAVSIYVIPYNLVSRVSIFPISLAGALFPRFAASAKEQANDLEWDSVAALLWVMTPVSITLIAVMGPFLHLWIGNALARQSTPLGYILVFGFWANSVAHVPYAFLEARGRPDLIAKYHIGILFPYLLVLYLCLHFFGILGAAIAWSARSFFDPSLFILTGSFRRIVPRLLVPALLVLSAMATALAFDWTSWPHWLLLAALLAIALYRSAHSLPTVVRQQLARLRSHLPWARFGVAADAAPVGAVDPFSTTEF
jgi:O-antigen/teichoic acid export membrane protein